MPIPTFEEVAKQPVEQRLARAARAADDVAAAIRGRSDAALSKRPDARNWSAKEVVCHLRDVEEMVATRFELVMANAEPRLTGVDPDRWAAERQYLRCDTNEALAAFRKRREENLAFLRGLAPDDWRRAGVHAVRGRFTVDDFVTLMAWHDDNHLDQLTRALDGRA
jgi:uncharacterized damage-inducible protein DinB